MENMQNDIYSHENIENLMNINPFMKSLYNSTVMIVYFGIVAAIWYFVHYAYTIGMPYEDIRCDECGALLSTAVKSFITIWIFSMIFYLLYEIRCRIWDLGKMHSIEVIKKTNWLIFGGSMAVTLYVSALLWFFQF